MKNNRTIEKNNKKYKNIKEAEKFFSPANKKNECMLLLTMIYINPLPLGQFVVKMAYHNNGRINKLFGAEIYHNSAW